MELKDTVEMMNSSNYKERFKAEYYQLDKRINGLTIMLNNYWEGSLQFKPSCSYDLLHEQLVYMKNYKRMLERRAEIENIEL